MMATEVYKAIRALQALDEARIDRQLAEIAIMDARDATRDDAASAEARVPLIFKRQAG